MDAKGADLFYNEILARAVSEHIDKKTMRIIYYKWSAGLQRSTTKSTKLLYRIFTIHLMAMMTDQKCSTEVFLYLDKRP